MVNPTKHSEITRRRAVQVLAAAVASAPAVARADGTVGPGSPPYPVQGTDRANWMAEHAQHLAGKKLSELCLPGTHDSGAYDFTREVFVDRDLPGLRAAYQIVERAKLGNLPSDITDGYVKKLVKEWGKAQGRDIAGQLMDGMRWLDLRTLQFEGDFYQYHGFIAHKVSETLQAVTAFVDAHPGEVVLLYFSHFQKSMDVAAHDRLAQLIRAVLGGRICPDLASAREKTIGTLVTEGHRVVVFYDGAPFSVRNANPWMLELADAYFYLEIKAASTTELTRQANQRIADYKLSLPMILGWTLTPEDSDIAESFGNQFVPFTPTHDLRWFTEDARSELAIYLRSKSAKLGVVTVDFEERSLVWSECVLRSIEPLKPEKTTRVKLIAAAPILHGNPDGSWSELASPYFQGDGATSVWASGPDNVFFASAGPNGSYAHYDGRQFDWGASPSDWSIHSIIGFSRNDVWAAGNYRRSPYGIAPVLLKLNATRNGWIEERIGPTSMQLYSIGGTNAGNLYVGGTVWRANEQKMYACIWHREIRMVSVDDRSGRPVTGSWWAESWSGLENRSIRAIWACAPDNVYAAAYSSAEGGALLHYDGKSWKVEIPDHAFQAIWASGPNNVVAVGSHKSALNGLIMRYNGAKWDTYTTAEPFTPLSGVYGSGPDDVTVTGRRMTSADGRSIVTVDPNVILTWDGTSWRRTTSPGGDRNWLWGVWQSS